MGFQFIVIIIVVSYLRKSLKTSVTMPVWNQRLKLALYVAIACIVLQVTVSYLTIFLNFVGYTALHEHQN